ncbi:MAG TPA: carbohydrate ABC transporter permease [Gaiellaceae bacterium]|jgi:multiple sugar transport system permease protein
MTVAAEAAPVRRRRRRTPMQFALRRALDALVLVLAVVFLAPIVWGFLGSLREVYAGLTGPAIPSPAHWDNYSYAWSGEFAFSHYLWNTVVLTLIATVPAVMTSALAGYAFARLRARGRNTFFIFVLGTTFIPVAVVFIPFFWVVVKLGMYSTRWPWLIWGISGSAYLIFLFRQFYASFPTELDDAAAIDGCGHLRTFLHVYLPNSAAPLAVAFMLLGTGWWGEYIYATLLLPDQLVPLGVKINVGYYDPGQQFTLVPVTLAASILFMLPPILAFFALQKKLARGIVTTGVKG